MTVVRFVHEPDVVTGHPTIELDTGHNEPALLTVCAHCGQLRSILFLAKDRWLCTKCRTEGATAPSLYPIA